MNGKFANANLANCVHNRAFSPVDCSIPMRKLLPILLALATPPVAAGYLDDVGFSALKLLNGADLATGANVVPTLVEAAVDVEHLGMTVAAWWPNRLNTELLDVTFVPLPPTDVTSDHATGSARRMAGDVSSMTPGVAKVVLFEADQWLSDFLLVDAAAGAAPLASASRIANHSWVGDYEDTAGNIDALQRIDWLINRDEFIQVVGNSNSATLKPLLANAFNTIAVGRTDATHSTGSLALDATYVAGRANPHLVAPLGSTSAATALASSAATLLIDIAQSDPALSREADIIPRNPAASPIKSAASSEVIKAVLMAGADRHTGNPGANITDYRAGAENQTSNGLDARFGAGQLNILRSHTILTAGEQNSIEDGGGTLLWSGFDYDPAFGGDGSNAVATYAFTTAALAAEITASLVWNLAVDEGPDYSPDPRLYNLDLELWQLDAGGDVRIASSTSLVDNTENIWTTLAADADYALRVVHAEPASFVWDYALAWHVQAVPIPGALPMLGGALALLGFSRRR